MKVRPFLALIFPGLVGMNATETVHEVLGAIEVPQVLPVRRNGAVTSTLVIVIAVVLDLFLRVMFFDALWRVAMTSPKLMLVGEIPSLGALDESGSSDCAIAGRAKSARIIIRVNARPAIDRVNDLKRI